MGKVIAPLHSIQVRGKVGEIIFRRWRNINTASNFTPATGDANQTNVVAMRAACTSWKTLSTDQMEAWGQYAKKRKTGGGILGPTHRSGYMTYSLAAYLAGQCGESYPTEPPESDPPNYPVDFTLIRDGSNKLLFSWDDSQDGDYIYIKCNHNKSTSERIYDYMLGIIGIYTIASGSKQHVYTEANRKARASGMVIRANGQAGPKGYVTLIT